jgi:hypothetical protein
LRKSFVRAPRANPRLARRSSHRCASLRRRSRPNARSAELPRESSLGFACAASVPLIANAIREMAPAVGTKWHVRTSMPPL